MLEGYVFKSARFSRASPHAGVFDRSSHGRSARACRAVSRTHRRRANAFRGREPDAPSAAAPTAHPLELLGTLAPQGRTFLGLDLAWSARNPSGVAALGADGRVIEARADLVGDAEILAWVRSHLAPGCVIGIDMPTIVPNEGGMRPCERDLAADFRRFHAAPHPSNRHRFGGEGRARAMLDELARDGVCERLDLEPQAAGRFAFEVYPHAAHVRLFALDAIFRYKKKTRPWPAVLAEWSRYRAALASLCNADPPLLLPASLPKTVTARGYKAWDDLLDAITCAYVASYLWRHGTAAPKVRIYGDLQSGYIAVPQVRLAPETS